MSISKIDFFQPAIWQEGALLIEIEHNLAAADDIYASGRWRPAMAAQVFEKVKQSLGGKPIESFDPAGYLRELGLTTSLTAGRTNTQVLHAYHLIKDYRADSRYFPFSKKAAVPVQKFFLFASRIAPRLLLAIDRILDPLAVRLTEKIHSTYRYRSNPYGRFDDIALGRKSDLPAETRYLGVLRKQVRQFAWDRGPHAGSIDPGRRGDENFGTYDIAVRFGFSRQQARRIARQCYDVDIGQTHYRDPHNSARPRITGTVGDIGDIQRHYNRNPDGAEDSRITGARIHLARAIRLADDGYYDAAEEEFAIGLHSLQDIFSHAQLTPSTHTCLGEFPDLVMYHPQAMFETALATEGYFRKFIAGLNLKPLEPVMTQINGFDLADEFIGGIAGPEEQALVSQTIDAYPEKLVAFLKNNGIRFFIATANATPAELGFGADLDGDGSIKPGHWENLNRDGLRHWFEVEDQYDHGKSWGRQAAGYNHHNRLVYISADIEKEAGFESVLKHEINHAIDCSLQDDPGLADQWNAYTHKLFNAARRRGEIAFDEMDKHEYFSL